MIPAFPITSFYASSAAVAVLLFAASTEHRSLRSMASAKPAVVESAVAVHAEPSSKISGPLTPVDVLRVIDGDTVEVRAHVWLEQTIITRVRLLAIDAPEIQAKCPLEAQKAQAARDYLADLLAHKPVYLTGLGRDKYGGRVTGRLINQAGQDMAEQMLSSGHARAYGKGRRQGWC